ncbi:MAG: GNAT family N-acetyltransferase [Deltaproteobacteria bacterium]|nr:GNAT family N-acetyltransferase [Deltaproteobacteria bacterium]
MTSVRLPEKFYFAALEKSHDRSAFTSGDDGVDRWLKKRARQARKKRLSITRVLLEEPNTIAGYYTLAMGQVNFDDLPHAYARKLPSTLLPIITLAWLGVDERYHGKGLGGRILAQALADCHTTGQAMPFVAVLLDCANPGAKSFYQHYDFEELPGHPMTLMLPWSLLDAMMRRGVRGEKSGHL